MKTNIKMRVTPEQSKKVQEIVFANGGKWRWLNTEVRNTDKETLFIDEEKEISHQFDDIEYFNEHEYLEVNADLFIRTNGTCNINDIKYVNWKLKGTDEKPLRIPITKETEELNKQIDNLCLKNSFWDKEKIEHNKDNATNPNHYNQMKIQPNEYITANKNCFSWYTANVIKYTSRYKSKNGIEDLEKAIKCLQFEIEELRKAEQNV